ncbi:MAG: hypothetical protein GY765_08110 [bacterium]|nr:hypothetical protein [bacterium]
MGITIDLASQLAVLIKDPLASAQAEAPWLHVLTRLAEELETDSDQRRLTGRRGFGLLLSTVPTYSVLRLAMPIIEEACRRIGQCYLFCPDPEPKSGRAEARGKAPSGKESPRGTTASAEGAVNFKEYKSYEMLLSKEIERMAEERKEGMRIFWKERALTIAHYSRRADISERSRSGLPETDPIAAALMLRLRPKVAALKPLARTPKPATSPLKHRESLKKKEGGFSGIRITRRAEDMEDILISEFLNPPILLADRLINSGYLALRRKPRHEKLRDLLLVALMPGEVQPRLNVDFIKACWFDFVTRLGLLLGRHKLLGSRFRWVEGDALGRNRGCTFNLDDLPLPEVPTGEHPTPAFRRGFLASLGWLPSFLDTRSKYGALPEMQDSGPGQKHSPVSNSPTSDLETGQKPPPVPNSPASGFQGEPPLGPPGGPPEALDSSAARWAASAWKRQAGDADEFAFLHVMVFLPQKEIEDDLPSHTRLAQLHRRLGFAGKPGRTISITCVPEVAEDTGKWAVHRPRSRDARLFPGAGSTGPTGSNGSGQEHAPWETIAGRLEQTWLEHLVEEIWNG